MYTLIAWVTTIVSVILKICQKQYDILLEFEKPYSCFEDLTLKGLKVTT